MRLTGKASANNVNWFDGVPINDSDVSVAGNVGPVFCEDATGVGVDFDLPSHVKSRSLESKIKPSDARKQRSHRHAAASVGEGAGAFTGH
jgi:hypothetical protein